MSNLSVDRSKTLTLNGVFMSFVAVRLDDSKVAHTDLGKVLRERIGTKNIGREHLPKAFQGFIDRPFLFQEKSNEIQLHQGIEQKEDLHEDVEKKEISIEDIRTSQHTADNALKIRIDFAVLLFRTFARIAHVLMNQRYQIRDDRFLLVKAFDSLQAVCRVHQIANVDTRMSTERTPEQTGKEIEQRL